MKRIKGYLIDSMVTAGGFALMIAAGLYLINDSMGISPMDLITTIFNL